MLDLFQINDDKWMKDLFKINIRSKKLDYVVYTNIKRLCFKPWPH